MLEVEPKSPERSDGKERGGGREDGERERARGEGDSNVTILQHPCYNFKTTYHPVGLASS